MIRGTPESMGFKREPKRDHLCKSPGCEVWRTPEGVLLILPIDCPQVGIESIFTVRGEVVLCREPAGVKSMWPRKKGETE